MDIIKDFLDIPLGNHSLFRFFYAYRRRVGGMARSCNWLNLVRMVEMSHPCFRNFFAAVRFK